MGRIEELFLAMADFGPHATLFAADFSATLARLLGTQTILLHKFAFTANETTIPHSKSPVLLRQGGFLKMCWRREFSGWAVGCQRFLLDPSITGPQSALGSPDSSLWAVLPVDPRSSGECQLQGLGAAASVTLCGESNIELIGQCQAGH